VVAEGGAQLYGAAVGGVAGFAALQGGDAGLDDGFGGDEVGFANAQRDDVLHGGGDIKEFADAGGF
jgi:hypothetical protein